MESPNNGEEAIYEELVETLEQDLLQRLATYTVQKQQAQALHAEAEVLGWQAVIGVERTVLTMMLLSREKHVSAEFTWNAVRECLLQDGQSVFLASFTGDEEKALAAFAKAKELRSVFRLMVRVLQDKKKAVVFPESGNTTESQSPNTDNSSSEQDNHQQDG